MGSGSVPRPLPVVAACSLDEGGYRKRIAAWRDLLRDARRRREGTDVVWEVPEARAGTLGELVAAERHCCAFLDLRVEDGDSGDGGGGDRRETHVRLRVGPVSGPAPGGRAAEAARLLGALG